MTINFAVNDYVLSNTAFIQKSLAYQAQTPMLAQTMASLGLLGNTPAQVTAVGTLDNNSFIRLLSTDTSNPTYNNGRGINLYFTSDDQLNNSFQKANAFLSALQAIRCLNDSGSTITKGQIVRQSGFNTDSQVATIALASAAASSTSGVLGIAAEDIANNAFGSVLLNGSFQGINTSGFSLGDTVYLGDTAGSIASSAGTETATLGRVLEVGTTGTISIFPTLGGGGSTPEADTWATVLARGLSSGSNNPMVPSGSRMIFGSTGLSGLALQYVNGDLEVGPADGSVGAGGIFGRRSSTNVTGGNLTIQGGYNTGTGGAGSLTLRGGQSSSDSAGHVFIFGGQSISGTDGSVFLGGNNTQHWQIEADGDFRTIAGTGLFSATALILGGETTSGIRLEVDSGNLVVREGDDSANANLVLNSITVGTTDPLVITDSTITRSGNFATITIGDTSGSVNIQGGGASGDVININSGNFGDTTFTAQSSTIRWNGTAFTPLTNGSKDSGTSTTKWRTSYQVHSVNSVTAISGATALSATSPELVQCTVSSSYALTLPLGTDCVGGRRFVIKDTGSASGGNVLTVTPSGSDTIDGQPSYTINVAYGSLVIFLDSDRDEWLIESSS